MGSIHRSCFSRDWPRRKVGVEPPARSAGCRMPGNSQVTSRESHVHPTRLQRYKRLLLAKRGELSAANGAETRLPPADEPEGDLMDRASAEAAAELQIRLHATDGRLFKAIEDALARIRGGLYGICETCKQPISNARLEAVPWTHLCRKCKEQRGDQLEQRGRTVRGLA